MMSHKEDWTYGNKPEPMNRIKDVMEGRGVKQTWLSEQLGKSYNMVNSYVQNRRQPSISDLFKIAEILNVKPSELINDPQ